MSRQQLSNYLTMGGKPHLPSVERKTTNGKFDYCLNNPGRDLRSVDDKNFPISSITIIINNTY